MSKILIVDDELGIREMLSDILTDEGHTVYTADSAEAARVFVLLDKYDLILLDIWMPDTDGITLLKEWGQPATSSKKKKRRNPPSLLRRSSGSNRCPC